MPTILLAVDRPAKFYMARTLAEQGYDVIPAVLYPKHATEEAAKEAQHWCSNCLKLNGRSLKSVTEVLKQCKQDKVKLDGVLISDPSNPMDDPFISEVQSKYVKAAEGLKQSEQGNGATINVEGCDDIARLAELAAINERLQAAEKNDLSLELRVMEDLLLTYPPSNNGIEVIKALRAADSLYRSIPIVVGYSIENKKDDFLKAGANQVRTTIEEDPKDYDGIAALMDELSKHGSIPAKPGGAVLAQGKKTGADHIGSGDSSRQI